MFNICIFAIHLIIWKILTKNSINLDIKSKEGKELNKDEIIIIKNQSIKKANYEPQTILTNEKDCPDNLSDILLRITE